MNNRERAKSDSYDRIDAFNNSNATDLATIPDYASELTNFNATRIKINAAENKQATDTSGAAFDSSSAKGIMTNTVIKFALRGAVKARNAGNNELAKQLAHHESYIYYAPKQLAIQYVTDMRDALNNNLTICTNVTAADITTIDAAINDYKVAQVEPIVARQLKKASGTDTLKGLIKDMDETVDNMYDLVYSYFYSSKPEMVKALRLAMQVINTGLHHTGIHLIAIHEISGDFLQGITIKIIELNKTIVTDINGLAQFDRVKAGTYHLEISGPGIATQNIVTAITRGHIAEMNIPLQNMIK
jgi:hypothetical protein